MVSTTGSWRALAVRYGDNQTTYGNAYYRWSSYGDSDGPLAMSYYLWVLEPSGGGGAVVIDTGFDPDRARRMGRRCLLAPAEALPLVGVEPASVQRLIVSHMHYDHIGNINLFPGARITISRRDYEFWARDPIAEKPQFAQHTDPNGVDQLRAAAAEDRLDLIEGRAEIVPGVTAVEVGGHSPGQLIFEVAGDSGPVALVTDAVHYYAELETERPFGIFSNLEDMYRGYGAVRALVARGATLVPGHDPDVMERFPRLDGPAGEFAVSVSDSRSEQ